jgi:hypothetical protein
MSDLRVTDDRFALVLGQTKRGFNRKPPKRCSLDFNR